MIFWVLACSLSTTKHDACEDDAVCRDAFGWGATCGEEGWCVAPELDADCSPLSGDPLGGTEPAVTLLALDGNGLTGEVGRALALAQSERPAIGDKLVQALICADADAVAAGARQSGATVLIGARAEGEARALLEVAQTVDAVVVSPAATDDALTFLDGLDADAPGRFWRTVGANRTEGAAIAEQMLTESTGATVLMLHAQSGHADEVADAFATQWTATPDARLYYAPWSGTAVATALSERPLGAPDVIVLSANDMSEVVAALSAIGADTLLADTLVWTTDTAFQDVLFSEADEAARSVFARLRGVGRMAPDAAQPFATRWATVYDAPPTLAEALAYDAAWVGLYGLHGAGEDSASGLAIADAVARMSSGDQVDVGPDGWSAGSAALTQGSVDIDGVTSGLDFDAWGDTEGQLTVWRVGDDGASFVHTDLWP